VTGRQRVVIVATLAAILGWRLLQVSGLALPAWVDSVHHALLVRMILDHGGVPATWAPYLPDVPVYYHFGFHLSTAALAWATGWTDLRIGHAVLVAGQLWQVAAAAGVFAAAWRLWRSFDTALVATVLVGFVSTLPAYYVMWGRYTLLAGMTLLAFGIAAAVGGRMVTLALIVAATGLTHYYAFLSLLAFVGLYAFPLARGRARSRSALAAGVGVLLASPWLLHVWRSTATYARPSRSSAWAAAATATPISALLGPTRNHFLLALAVAGLAWVVHRARRQALPDNEAARALAAWAVLHVVLLGPWQVGPFRPDHAALVLFLPVVLLAAPAITALGGRAVTVMVMGVLVLWGLAETRRPAGPSTALAGAADLKAAAWVAANTPPRAVFLVDVAPWMGIWRGADGGWWISPLTGRRTVPPPVAYGWGAPELAALVRGHAERLAQLVALAGPERCAALERLFDETGADFYYTRRSAAAGCANLQALYREEGIAIYSIAAPPPASPEG
jgi:hypothetical protein